MRGFVITEMISVESILSFIIFQYFLPKHQNEFEQVLLNSSVIGLGGKIKILQGLEIIDKQILENIKRLSSIRNGFAHAHLFTEYDSSVKPENTGHDKIDVMNAQGILKKKNAFDYFIEFNNLIEGIQDKLIKKYKEMKTRNEAE